MEKISFPKGFKVYLPLIGLFFILVFLMPRSPKFKYDYRKGSPWMYETLIAQFDFPILKTEAQMQADLERANRSMVAYFVVDPEVSSRVKETISAALPGAEVKSAASEALSSIYSKGILAEMPLSADQMMDDEIIYVQRDRRAAKIPVSEVYAHEQAMSLLRAAVAEVAKGTDVDSLFAALGVPAMLLPDHIFDQQTTDLIHEESGRHLPRTQGIVRSGQVIVSRGELVTSEIEQILDSYKAEYDANIGYSGPKALQLTGVVFMALAFVLVLFLSIYYCNYRIFSQYNKYLYILLIYLISTVTTFLASKVSPTVYYMIPFPLIALYLLAFFKKRVVYVVYVVSLLPMLVFAPNGVELFVMYFVAGVVCILVFHYFNKGWLQFVTALIVFLVMVLMWFTFQLIDGQQGFGDYNVIFNMALGAFLSVAGYPLIYLFEKMFSLVSNTKLADLSDTSNRLLRQLADKAPGTFQHSLQVMNLADAAARAIDANVLLVRAGALYHDIGKINNPQCFTENETPGVKYHEGLSAKESAQDIIRHVSDGVMLAEKHGLPDVVTDFITTHHGTTSASFFYNKYLSEGGDPQDRSSFFYTGIKPRSKEQVILMICDAVEAASRSLKDYSAESISELVERIVAGKISEGQFDDASVSMKEINVLKREIKEYLQQMYHSRIAYPKR